jgi:alpha-galactosidase
MLKASDVHENLAAMAELWPQIPLQVCQIDDGFEACVGDWFSFSPAFPQGVQPLAAEIRAAGFTPGLWLAPFMVHPRSRLAEKHPDWLLRGGSNRPVNAGYLWGALTTALDLTHPPALDYACQVVHTAVHEWGYPYLKLDFLYAAALPGKYRDRRRTRAQVLRHGLEALRAAAGEEATLLGCGCPLGSAIGLVDAMRISADTARRWYASWKGIEFFFKGERTLPSARNALHNVLTRAPLHQRWWTNDPDCLQVRPDTFLTQAEVETIATVIALSGGSLMLSDRLSQLPPQRLRMVEVLLPLMGRRPQVPDWFDRATPRRLRLDLENASGQWHLLALINWDDAPQTLSLRLEDFHLPPPGASAPYSTCFVSRFWQAGEAAVFRHAFAEAGLTFEDVPAHGVVLVALRPALPDQPQYLGSDLHISQGLEVTAWQAQPQRLSLTLERPGHARGHLYLSLPRPPRQAWLNDRPLAWQAHPSGCFILEVDFEREGKIHLHFA